MKEQYIPIIIFNNSFENRDKFFEHLFGGKLSVYEMINSSLKGISIYVAKIECDYETFWSLSKSLTGFIT